MSSSPFVELFSSEPIMADFGISLILAIVAVGLQVASELLKPKPKKERTKPASLGDFGFATATEDRKQPLLWGRLRLSGPNIIWYGDFRQQAIRQTLRMGLFSKTRITKGFRYYLGLSFGICRGGTYPVTLHEVTVGEKPLNLVGGEIQSADLFGGEEFGTGGIISPYTFWPGSLTQSVSSYLSQFQTPTPAYRGMARFDLEGGYVGTATNLGNFAFEVSRYPNGLQLQAAADLGGSNPYSSGHHIVGQELNPMELVYEQITNTEWGMSVPSAGVDIATFATVAELLFDEGNGISFVRDTAGTHDELRAVIEEQCDIAIYKSRTTGLWTAKAVRDDYTVAALQEITMDNVVEVKQFNRQTWDGTLNRFEAGYTDRDDDYKTTSVPATSNANLLMQGRVNQGKVDFKGVFTAELAAQLATRELRQRSYPLVTATVVVNREFWAVERGDVLRWTYTHELDPSLSFVDLPMRVGSATYGEFDDAPITLTLQEDIFSLEEAATGVGAPTGWTSPTQEVLAIPADQQLVIECPKGIVDRDVVQETVANKGRVLVAVRAQSGEVQVGIYQRNALGVPAGAFAKDGTVEGFMLIATLAGGGLGGSDANPTTSITVTGSPDSLSSIGTFFAPASVDEIGQGIENLVLIDGEFIGVRDFDPMTGVFSTAYRGLLGTVISAHSAGALVYLLYAGAGMNDSDIPQGNTIHVRPRTKSRDEELADGSAVQVDVTLSNRYFRPYPPSRVDLNSVRFDATVSIEDGLEVDWYRRAHESPSGGAVDEVAQLEVDAATIDGSFPASRSHENRARAYAADAVTLLADSGWLTGTTHAFGRSDLLKVPNGVLPASIVVSVGARHDIGALTNLEAPAELAVTTTPSDAELAGLENLGTLGAQAVSGGYVVANDVDHNFRLEGGTLSGAVEYRIGTGGSWTSLIAALGTTGSISSGLIAVSDVLYFRHLDNADAGANVVLIGGESGGGDELYAILSDDAELDRLMGAWSMDETSDGSVQVDREAAPGSRIALVDVNTTSSQTGKFGLAARCRDNAGTPEYLTLAAAVFDGDLLIDYSKDWTLSCWVRHATGTAATAGGSAHTQGYIFRGVFPGGTPNISDRSFFLGLSATTGYAVITYNGTGAEDGRVNSGALANATENVWHLLTATFVTSTQTLTLYLDGVSEGTDTTSGTMNVPATTEDVLVGAVNLGTGGTQVSVDLSAEDTAIDDVRIYHRALSGPEVAAMFAATQSVPSA